MATSKGKRKHWLKVALVAGLVYVGFRVVEEKGVKPKLSKS
jgi:hypothetical protein